MTAWGWQNTVDGCRSMLARKAFEAYKSGQSIDQTVRSYIEENKLENTTTYAEYVDAVNTMKDKFLEWCIE
jgi:hypothetical protein